MPRKEKKIFIISGTHLVLVSGRQLQPTHQISRWAAGGETFFLVSKKISVLIMWVCADTSY